MSKTLLKSIPVFYKIVDVFHILLAVSTALYTKETNSMSTRNIFTEIVYNFSPTRNISKSLNLFGISAFSKDILVIVPNPVDADVEAIRKCIVGVEVLSIEEGLKEVSDVTRIRSVYAITAQEQKSSSLIDSVVTRMACRPVR